MNQSQRRDIDLTLEDRVDLVLDDENLADNPFVFEPSDFVGNNWFKQVSNIVKLNLAEQDSIVFLSAPLTKLSQKDISNVIVSFDYDISNVSVNYPILSNCSLTCMEMTNYFLVENILSTQGHIDIDCSLFNFSSNVVNTAISEQGFKVGINFVGNKSNATVKLSNVQIQFKYKNRLSSQSDSVINRLEPYVDFWREDDDLVLQIGGDASGKGIDHSGGDVDTYTKSEIDAKLDLKVNTEVGKGLSSNDYTLSEKTKLASVETNANYYVHPSSHNSSIITESSALSQLETSENATQHEINLAINEKIGQGGSGSGGSYINDYYWDNESQDIILDYDSGVSEADIVTSWSSPLRDDRVPSEKLVKEYVDNSGGGSSVDIVTTWEQVLSDSKVASEKLVKNTIDSLSIPSKVSDLTNDTGFITSSSLPTKVSDLQNDVGFTTFDGDYDSLTNKPTIPTVPTNVSAFTNDVGYLTQHQSLSNYVQKSSTNGLLKNDGSVDTNAYITSSALPTIQTNWGSTTSDSKVASEKLIKDTLDLKVDFDCADGNNTFYEDDSLNGMLYLFNGVVDFNLSNGNLRYNSYKVATLNDIPSLTNYVQKSSTTGLLRNNGTVDTTSYATSSQISSMLTDSDIVDNLTTNDATKVLSAKQGKELKDLIGSAISYINQ